MEAMIEFQLIRRGISEPAVLHAFERIPRLVFMPPGCEHEAYSDHPTPIPCGQTISQPFIVALMMQYLHIEHPHHVLEIGTGSGYSTALLSTLAARVDSVELHPELLRYAQDRLTMLGISNVRLFAGSGWKALPVEATYDRIIVWASPPRVPQPLLDQLKDGGRLILPEGRLDQYVYLYRKNGDELNRQRLDAVRFVPLVKDEQIPLPFSVDDGELE